jgi:steroid delta-isomerase-like uncharacterized protein
MKTYLFLSICILALSFANKSENNPVKENEAIARELMKAWDSHDTDKLCSLFADEFVYTEMASGNSYSNKYTLSTYFNSTIAGIPDTKVEIIAVMANEKFAAVEWIWKGTNTVGWDFMGIPATNKYFELPGVSVMEIENQKIIRNNDYWEWNTFIRLIGAGEE